MKNDLISIVIPAFNAKEYIASAIESVLGQEGLECEFEIIVVDDCSQDGTVSFVREKFNLQSVRVIELEKNSGPAHARNVGIEASKGNYISLLDSDDIFQPEKLASQYTFLENNPGCGAVITASKTIVDKKYGKDITYHFPVTKLEQAKEVFFSKIARFTSTLFFRKELYQSTGGFDCSMNHFEDHEFLLRCIKHSNLGYINQLLTCYRVRDDGLSGSISEVSFLNSRQKFEEKAFDIFPELKVFEHEYWSNEYFGLGKILLFQKRNRKRSRSYFKKSISGNMQNVKPYIGLMLSYLPLFVSMKIRKKLILES